MSCMITVQLLDPGLCVCSQSLSVRAPSAKTTAVCLGTRTMQSFATPQHPHEHRCTGVLHAYCMSKCKLAPRSTLDCRRVTAVTFPLPGSSHTGARHAWRVPGEPFQHRTDARQHTQVRASTHKKKTPPRGDTQRCISESEGCDSTACCVQRGLIRAQRLSRVWSSIVGLVSCPAHPDM